MCVRRLSAYRGLAARAETHDSRDDRSLLAAEGVSHLALADVCALRRVPLQGTGYRVPLQGTGYRVLLQGMPPHDARDCLCARHTAMQASGSGEPPPLFFRRALLLCSLSTPPCARVSSHLRACLFTPARVSLHTCARVSSRLRACLVLLASVAASMPPVPCTLYASC